VIARRSVSIDAWSPNGNEVAEIVGKCKDVLGSVGTCREAN